MPGKKFLNDKLEFVIYQFEGFRSDNSQILLGFIEKYPQNNLDEEQKQILFKFKNEQYSIDVLTKILFSMQLMIRFIMKIFLIMNKLFMKPSKNFQIISKLMKKLILYSLITNNSN